MPVRVSPGRAAGVVAAAAGLYVVGLSWTLRWAIAIAPVAAGAALLALWMWGRRPDRAGPRLADAAVPLVALYALPFARLALWNAESPLTRTLFELPRWFHEALPGPRVQDEALPLPLWLALMLLRLLPFAALGVAVGVLPLAFGALARHVGRQVRRRAPPAAAGALAVTFLFGSVVAWPVVCDTHESFEDVPNARCTCEGLVVSSYPPGWFDASSTEYCIGIERPLPPPR